ncbi:putative homeobox and C2H2 transcription factor [Aspergillus undulatus]|uniref:putative homeobox and C2H2 transcription factor n=1 Tax=Aspergillus undulatus TaxID=1810928 RepID=UPI003CCCAF3B
MEFFDFDEAASGSHASHARDDDVASDQLDFDEIEVEANYQSLLQDQSEPPNFLPRQREPCKGILVDGSFDPDGVYPMFRAQDPCDFCRNMGLDCFMAKRGVMQKSGCTCCISLYRECSFTQTMPQGKSGLDTLHPISENIDIPTGGLTGKKVLKSFSGITEDVEGRARKSSSRLSREAVRILKAWLYDHSDHPYPTEEEKEELKLCTGLKRTQITNWLANARRRGKIRPAPRSSSPVPGAIEIPRQPEVDHTLMTPLERWKYSPPENEPAAISNILRALEDPSLEVRQGSRAHPRRTGSSNDSSHANSNVFDASSLVSSHENSQSASRSSLSDLSFASAFSHRSSIGSYGSMDRKERRRRRKPSTPANAFAQQKAKSARIYQCTFCADSFQTKYDWQRHEKSLHLALEKWTCAPHGGVTFIKGANRCVFCMAVDPDNEHLEAHNYSTCAEKSSAERTFYRKDHLNQHLRLMHNVRFDPFMDQWRSHTTEIISRCGFCGITLTTWKGRADHLATHFKNGADMNQWQGDWGFEPVVQNLVENAMPPYLIGQERNSLDPFKLSDYKAGAPGLTIPEDANCFERLKLELTAFIRGHLSSGAVPTDQMIQEQGRRVVYGSDDPWNQTCADNPVWLSILKRDAGLEPAPGSEHIQFANLGMQPPFASRDGLRQPPVCARAPAATGYHSSGFQSPALPGTGRSSAVPSARQSSAGSFSGSGAMFSAAPSGLSTDFGSCCASGKASSFSTPLSTSVDPFVQMGFDPEFLRHLNNRYDEELPLDEMEGLNFGVDHGGSSNVIQPMDMAGANVGATAPIAIPTSKQPDMMIPDAVPSDVQFKSTDRAGM